MTTGLSHLLFSGGECPTHGEKKPAHNSSSCSWITFPDSIHSDMSTDPASNNNTFTQGFPP